jgi:hypothetical protein
LGAQNLKDFVQDGLRHVLAPAALLLWFIFLSTGYVIVAGRSALLRVVVFVVGHVCVRRHFRFFPPAAFLLVGRQLDLCGEVALLDSYLDCVFVAAYLAVVHRDESFAGPAPSHSRPDLLLRTLRHFVVQFLYVAVLVVDDRVRRGVVRFRVARLVPRGLRLRGRDSVCKGYPKIRSRNSTAGNTALLQVGRLHARPQRML